jgi:DNA-binding beta-propeller fold protein YncE
VNTRVIQFGILLLVFGLTTAQAQGPLYRQTAKFEIGGEGGWDYINYDPSSNRLLVGHSTEITVIDVASGKKIGSVPATGAHGAVVDPEKKLGFSTNGRAGTVTVFDATTFQPKQDIKVGDGPDAILFDPYSKKVVEVNGRSKDMMVINPESLKIETTIALGGAPEAMVSDASHLYVNVEDTSEIASVDSKTWKVDHRWKLTGCEGPSGLALDEETNHLFSVCENKKMAVVDLKNGNVIATVDTGAGTDGAAFDSELGNALASNGRDGTLTVVQLRNGKYETAGQVPTQIGARTIAVDSKSHKVFLPVAEYLPAVAGQQRRPVKPGTFAILVFEPAK